MQWLLVLVDLELFGCIRNSLVVWVSAYIVDFIHLFLGYTCFVVWPCQRLRTINLKASYVLSLLFPGLVWGSAKKKLGKHHWNSKTWNLDTINNALTKSQENVFFSVEGWGLARVGIYRTVIRLSHRTGRQWTPKIWMKIISASCWWTKLGDGHFMSYSISTQEKSNLCVQFHSPKTRLFWDSYRGCCLIYQQHDKYCMLLSHYISVSKSPLHSPENSLQITKKPPDHPNDLYSTVGLGGGIAPADIGPPEAGAVLDVAFA